MSEFNVGDKVRVLSYGHRHNYDLGKEYTIVLADDDNTYKLDSCDGNWIWPESFELVEPECEPCVGVWSKAVLINKKEKFMSKATNYIKNLTLTADEKLLRKYGFKDSCGDYTGEAVDLVKAKLVKDNEDYLISIAKGLEEEAKENK